MSFAVITLCVVSQRVFIIVVYFVIDSFRIILDTSLYLRLITTFTERNPYVKRRLEV
jgi:hypothetical protein